MRPTKAEVEEKSVEIFNLICPLWIGNSMKITSTRTDKDGKTRGVDVVLHFKDMLKPIQEAVKKAK